MAASENHETNPPQTETFFGSFFTQAQNLVEVGIAKAKELDEELQISTKVQGAVETATVKAKELDEQYQLTEKAKTAVAAGLDKVNEIDEQLQISTNVKSAAEQGTAKVKEIDDTLGLSQAVKRKVTELDESLGVTTKLQEIDEQMGLSTNVTHAVKQTKKTVARLLPNTDPWENMWRTLEPGQKFDASIPAPILNNIVTNDHWVRPNSRVLIPGCGRGYAVQAFASTGKCKCYGLEIAPTAVQAASEYLSEQGLPEDSWEIVEGDFFEFEFREKFDIIYDYTFCCIFNDEQRHEWALRMSQLLKPEGFLIQLMFPLNKKTSGGPPFVLDPNQVVQCLDDVGFVLASEEYPRVLEDSESHAKRGGGDSAISIFQFA